MVVVDHEDTWHHAAFHFNVQFEAETVMNFVHANGLRNSPISAMAPPRSSVSPQSSDPSVARQSVAGPVGRGLEHRPSLDGITTLWSPDGQHVALLAHPGGSQPLAGRCEPERWWAVQHDQIPSLRHDFTTHAYWRAAAAVRPVLPKPAIPFRRARLAA